MTEGQFDAFRKQQEAQEQMVEMGLKMMGDGGGKD